VNLQILTKHFYLSSDAGTLLILTLFSFRAEKHWGHRLSDLEFMWNVGLASATTTPSNGYNTQQ